MIRFYNQIVVITAIMMPFRVASFELSDLARSFKLSQAVHYRNASSVNHDTATSTIDYKVPLVAASAVPLVMFRNELASSMPQIASGIFNFIKDNSGKVMTGGLAVSSLLYGYLFI